MSRRPNNPGIPKWCGESLRIRRLYAGWTIRELAESVGVTKTTVHRWERNENAPTSDDLERLSRRLDVSPSVFATPPKIV